MRMIRRRAPRTLRLGLGGEGAQHCLIFPATHAQLDKSLVVLLGAGQQLVERRLPRAIQLLQQVRRDGA